MSKSLQEQLAAMLTAGALHAAPPREPRPVSKKMKILQRAKTATTAITTTVPEDRVQNTGNPPTEVYNEDEPTTVAEVTQPTAPNGQSGVTVTPESNDGPADITKPSEPLTEVQTSRLRSALTLMKATHAATEDGIEHLRVTSVRAQKLAKAVHSSLKGNRKPEAREAVANAEWVANATRSMYEARRSNDLDAGDINVTRKQALAKLENLDMYLADPAAVEASSDARGTAVESVRLENMPEKYFAKYRRYASKLPSASDMRKKGQRFQQIQGLPLTVIFRHEVKPATLEGEGFEVSDDGGYLTLLNQSLWAINTAALDADPNWQKGPKQATKAINAKVKVQRTKVGADAQGHGDVEAYLHHMLGQARRRYGHPFVIMGPEGHQRINHRSTPGIVYYWVMPVREQAALPSPVEGMGLPF